jgi:hypothetical protein
MTITSELANRFADKPWFHSIDTDQYGRLVVYTRSMDQEICSLIPDRFEGKQVLLHFAPPQKEVKEVKSAQPAEAKPKHDPKEDLTHTVWSLKRICGPDELYDLLFEIIDEEEGEEVMTDYSAEFPEVRKSLERLYAAFGFEAILDEVER